MKVANHRFLVLLKRIIKKSENATAGTREINTPNDEGQRKMAAATNSRRRSVTTSMSITIRRGKRSRRGPLRRGRKETERGSGPLRRRITVQVTIVMERKG